MSIKWEITAVVNRNLDLEILKYTNDNYFNYLLRKLQQFLLKLFIKVTYKIVKLILNSDFVFPNLFNVQTFKFSSKYSLF